jgi:hypothetical protein
VPLTREQFLCDLSRPDLKDFASHVKRGNLRGGASDEYYSDLYERSASVARRVCDEVESLDVTVRRAARLSEFTELLRNFKVVTLVTHWRFTRLSPDDILDPRALWRALAAPEGHVQQAVARSVSRSDPELLAQEETGRARDSSLRERLATTLNSIAAAAHALYGGPNSAVLTDLQGASPGVIERLTRVELEQAFPGLIAFGKSVEFSEGMLAVQNVADAVPHGFDGVLDLTMCNSVILGKAIKAKHPDCLVAMNRYAIDLYVGMPIYKLVIEDLARRPAPFTDTLSKFHTN